MVYLVNEQLVLDSTAMDKNLLSANLKPAILICQKINVSTICGDKLINKIYSDIENNTLSGNYKKLVDDYLTDLTIYGTLYHASTNLLTKFTNRGLQTEFSETSTSTDLSVYREIKSDSRNKMEFFAARANKWLYQNRQLFPEYELCATDNGTMPANANSPFFSGLVL